MPRDRREPRKPASSLAVLLLKIPIPPNDSRHPRAESGSRATPGASPVSGASSAGSSVSSRRRTRPTPAHRSRASATTTSSRPPPDRALGRQLRNRALRVKRPESALSGSRPEEKGCVCHILAHRPVPVTRQSQLFSTFFRTGRIARTAPFLTDIRHTGRGWSAPTGRATHPRCLAVPIRRCRDCFREVVVHSSPAARAPRGTCCACLVVLVNSLGGLGQPLEYKPTPPASTAAEAVAWRRAWRGRWFAFSYTPRYGDAPCYPACFMLMDPGAAKVRWAYPAASPSPARLRIDEAPDSAKRSLNRCPGSLGSRGVFVSGDGPGVSGRAIVRGRPRRCMRGRHS